MGKGGNRVKRDPLSTTNPELYIRKRQENNNSVKKSREKKKIAGRILDEEIARETLIFQFRSRKVSGIEICLQQINEARANSFPLKFARAKFIDTIYPLSEELTSLKVIDTTVLFQQLNRAQQASTLPDLFDIMLEFSTILLRLDLP